MAIYLNGTTGISGVDGSSSTPALQGSDSNTGISFGTDIVTINTGGVARVTTDSSGNVGIGTTGFASSVGGGIALRANVGGSVGNIDIGHAAAAGTGNGYVQFFWNGGAIGSITQSGTTAVAYNTSSDYRLKESITPMTGALAKNELLNPVTYKWKSDGSDGQGFIAHELQAVFPDAVTGEKDAVDADGNPQYQGVDTSFLVGHLVACVKELKSELDSVKAELATLKAGA